MWGTSSPDDKLTGDLGNVIEATSTGGRRSEFFTAEKLAAGNLGLFQQHRSMARITAPQHCCLLHPSQRNRFAAKGFRVVPRPAVSSCSNQSYAEARLIRSPHRQSQAICLGW